MGGNEPMYTRANTDWFARCRYGLAVHWTAQTAPLRGAALGFQDAVAQFDMSAFIDGVLASGADYVLFTVTHALHMLPCPHPVVDSILPGRTSKRDLIAELALRLNTYGKRLLLYYNHSCNNGEDPEWEDALGYHTPPAGQFMDRLVEIIEWMGEFYGSLVSAWWFDSAYSLDPRGPHNSFTSTAGPFDVPRAAITAAAKAGEHKRLVTYNAGVNETFLYTEHQDYWAGEMVDLDHPPQQRYLSNGLQWHGWTCLEDRRWVHSQADTDFSPPLYTDEELLAFLRLCVQHQAPMTFNVSIAQDGTMAERSIAQLGRIGEALRRTADRPTS